MIQTALASIVSTIRRWQLLTLIFAGLMMQGAMQLSAQTVSSDQSRATAIFLSNFTQFVNWPPGAFRDDDAPLVIGVLGDNTLGASLDDAVRNKLVHRRQLKVERFRRPEDTRACQILFVGKSEEMQLKKTFSILKHTDVLTVSDAGDFAARGGMIQLAPERGGIRLKINVDAARASGIVISSKVLRSAEIVASKVD